MTRALNRIHCFLPQESLTSPEKCQQDKMETWSPASGTYNYTHTHIHTYTHTHTHTHTHSEYNSSNRLQSKNAWHGVAVQKMLLLALEHIPDTLSLGPEDISPIEEISCCSVSIQTHKRLIKCLTGHLELNSYYSILCFLIFS